METALAYVWNYAWNFKSLLLVILIFVPLEWLFALHREQRLFRRLWQLDALYVLINPALIGFFMNGLLFVAVLLVSQVIPSPLQAWMGAQPWWLQFPILLLAADLGFYGMHRLFHAVPVLWRFHAVHHSIEELDWLAGHRVHPMDQILTKGASLVPVFALGFSEGAIAAFFVMYFWQSLLIHSNVKLEFGPLGRILATPRFHHWHHANQAEAFDRNFAGQLPFIDWIFGTLYMPEREMPRRYGTDVPVPPGFLAQMIFPMTKPEAPAPYGGQPQDGGEKSGNPATE